jgi:hypothetical protein
MAGYNETDTKGYRFIIFVLSLTVFIVTTIMTFKYRQVLDTDDDTLIGMSRGTVIWFYWLNIILAIISFFVFFINLFKILFGKKSIGSLIPKFLTEENTGIFEYNDETQVLQAQVTEPAPEPVAAPPQAPAPAPTPVAPPAAAPTPVAPPAAAALNIARGGTSDSSTNISAAAAALAANFKPSPKAAAPAPVYTPTFCGPYGDDSVLRDVYKNNIIRKGIPPPDASIYVTDYCKCRDANTSNCAKMCTVLGEKGYPDGKKPDFCP